MLQTPKIKTKNLNSFKYKKNEIMLNNFEDFQEDKIDYVTLIEQGNDIVSTDSVKAEQKEYAIIKVYFKGE